MIYSCFQQAGGVYAYFEVPGELPLNADLPVPRLPAPTGNIGVPSIEAGRPLPSNAKFVGTGWHAKGMIARCDGRGLGAMPPLSTTLLSLAIVGGIAAGAMYWLKQRRSKTA